MAEKKPTTDADAAAPQLNERDEARAQLVRRLFEEHNRALVGFLTARLHSHAEAWDVAQEAYVRMLQLDSASGVSFMRAYLFRVAENLAVDRLRHRAVREANSPQVFIESLLARPGPERTVLARQEVEIIKDALRELPARCRSAFALHLFGEQSVAAIAHSMGVTERLIRRFIAAGLAHCRARLDAESGRREGSES
jgi:RNA polymerase sigma-70 factor (ECF subfamily)